MSAYVCLSKICERRDRCMVARYPAPGDVHVIYFTPPEETHGNCPHFMASEPGKAKQDGGVHDG